MTARFPSPVLIIGARSDVGRALAHRYGEAGCSLVLAARDSARLADDRADLELRHGVEVRLVECDVLNTDPEAFYAALPTSPGTIVMVAGLLGDQARSENDLEAAARVFDTNFVGPALLLLAGARLLEARGEGCIIGISSVAGDRGRASNYVYGSAKAGLTAFLSGLRGRLSKTGVHVMTVKPGFIATAMTAGMRLPPILTAQADEVAGAILRAQSRKADVVYTKPVWALIMLVIRAIPERIFKRLSL